MKHIDSNELLTRTKTLVALERKATLALIAHLQEIERRMLYAKLGYGSLWEFATQELGLSEGAAQRRIQAMRLVRDVPQAKGALESGKLSLSNAAKVQSFRQAEKRHGRTADAPDLIAKVESLSQRDCEKVLLQISPESIPQERERLVTASGDREIKMVVSARLFEKIQRLKALLSHAIPEATYAQLVEYLVDQTLPRLEKKKGLSQAEQGITLKAHSIFTRDVSSSDLEVLANLERSQPSEARSKIQNATAAVKAIHALPAGVRVYLPVAMKRAIWARGQGQCEITVCGRRCQSRTRIEIDHIEPLALGGANELSNLRLTCWHHNQQQAREKL